MTVLVGDTGAGYVTAAGQASSGDAYWVENGGVGYTASASGAVATAHININAWPSATDLKIVAYNSSRVKLGESAVINSAGGTGHRQATMTGFSITSAQTYFIVMIPASGFVDLNGNGVAFSGGTSQPLTSYASPPDPLPAAAGSIGALVAIWLEDAGAAGSGRIIPGCLTDGLLLGSLAK